MKIAIVVSQFNKKISENLVEGAFDTYKKNNYDLDDISVFEVPGAFEVPFFIKKILTKKDNDYDAIITFGSVIKGETAHFDFISKTVTDQIMNLSINNSFNIPILYGILTTYDYSQALERSMLNKKNKGGEVMQATLDLLNTINKLK
jgi:6,7-dimethyl-8-ribityllumazine synthase